MKPIGTIILGLAIATGALAGNTNDSLSKDCFYKAKLELEDMLSGKIPLNYERAVFITENAYWEEALSYEKFEKAIELQTSIIEKLVKINNRIDTMKFNASLFETVAQKRAKHLENLKHGVLFKYFKDTIYYLDKNALYIHLPYTYSYNDPVATSLWSNSQVVSLLTPAIGRGNCYAMTALYKILSDRLKINSTIVTASGHIFIEHENPDGRHYNVELGAGAFPGNGSIETLTYTTDRALKNGISMRSLNLKQSIGLCLVYLAKGYANKFNENSSSFMLDCAELCISHDSLNLNALLLKQEIQEERLISEMRRKGVETFSQANSDDILGKHCKEYEKIVTFLYNKGYKEMPMEMKNIILSGLNGDGKVIMGQDHTPQPFKSIGIKTRYATLSNGLFDEMIVDKPVEKISRTEFNTKAKKIIGFSKPDTTYNNYAFDPVVFAWNIDPLAAKYPFASPYNFVLNNPIINVDKDGREVFIYGEFSSATFAEIQKVTSLKLAYDCKTHQLTAIGKPETTIDKALFSAITDESTKVRLFTTNEKTGEIKGERVGLLVGGYGGSEIAESKNDKAGFLNDYASGDLSKVADSEYKSYKTVTTQYFNYEQSEALENAGISTIGHDAAHEILESFFGGVYNAGGGKEGYQNAHNRAEAADPNLTKVARIINELTGDRGIGSRDGSKRVILMNVFKGKEYGTAKPNENDDCK